MGIVELPSSRVQRVVPGPFVATTSPGFDSDLSICQRFRRGAALDALAFARGAPQRSRVPWGLGRISPKRESNGNRSLTVTPGARTYVTNEPVSESCSTRTWSTRPSLRRNDFVIALLCGQA